MAFVAPSITNEDIKELLAQLFNSCLLVIGAKDPGSELDDAMRAKWLNRARTNLTEAFERYIETIAAQAAAVGRPKP